MNKIGTDGTGGNSRMKEWRERQQMMNAVRKLLKIEKTEIVKGEEV